MATTKKTNLSIQEILERIAGSTTGFMVEIEGNIKSIHDILFTVTAFKDVEGCNLDDELMKAVYDSLGTASDCLEYAIDIIRSNGKRR